MRSTRSSVSRFLSTFLLLAVVASAAFAQGSRTEAVALGDGVLVDATRGVAYLMNEELRIDAVEIATGVRLWRSAEPAKPLLVAGELLVAQTVSRQAGRLDIGSIDLRTGRSGALRGRVDLPEGVKAQLFDTLEGSFRVRAQLQGDQVILSWSATKSGEDLPQGYLPSDDENLAPALDASRTPAASVASKQARRLEGTAQIHLSSGRVGAPVKAATPRKPLDLLADGKLRGKGRQFASADGNHALVSERVTGADIWQSYRWTIYERGTGEPLGKLSHHTSSAPFVVFGDRLVYLSQRYLRHQGGELVDEPRQLRVVDLSDGAEVLAMKTSEPDFQGPFPP